MDLNDLANNSTDWLLTLFSVHFVMLVGIIALYRGAPCWIQKTLVGILTLGATFFVAGYFAALLGVNNWVYILFIGFVLEHLAVMLYVFRMHWNVYGNPDRSAPKVRRVTQ